VTRPVITLTTDFGQADGYVAAMKGVILDLCPEAVLVDISHEIQPQAIRQAAYVLSTAAPYFPAGAVHLVVVDPGVGSARRAIAVQTARAFYVAPDNGLLDLALTQDPAQQVVHLTAWEFQRPQVSATFHGRDIFAPAAAHLARGVAIQDMGQQIDPATLARRPARPPARRPDGAWRGEILHVDHFGNLITDIQHLPEPSAQVFIQVGGTRIVGLSRTFADVEPGELVAYVGSSGHLEIAVREGDATTRLGLSVGDPVIVGTSP